MRVTRLGESAQPVSSRQNRLMHEQQCGSKDQHSFCGDKPPPDPQSSDSVASERGRSEIPARTPITGPPSRSQNTHTHTHTRARARAHTQTGKRTVECVAELEGDSRAVRCSPSIACRADRSESLKRNPQEHWQCCMLHSRGCTVVAPSDVVVAEKVDGDVVRTDRGGFRCILDADRAQARAPHIVVWSPSVSLQR
jgi:hypothetical protein